MFQQAQSREQAHQKHQGYIKQCDAVLKLGTVTFLSNSKVKKIMVDKVSCSSKQQKFLAGFV